MNRSNTLIPVPITREANLKTLVENRTAFTLEHCELNIFETHVESHEVPLKFNDLVVTSMLRGKKVMKLFEDPAFDYFPGETVLVPAGVTMNIDFPEARSLNPTQCIALAIDHQAIQTTLNLLNERYPLEGNNRFWQLQYHNYHFQNNPELATLLNKLIALCGSGNVCKDVLADLALQELIVSLVQLQNLNLAKSGMIATKNQSPISFVADFLVANAAEDHRMEDLAAKACMSKATFYRAFKREYGLTPLDFLTNERLRRAKLLLSKAGTSVKTACLESGFSDVNYFIRMFKKIEGITPRQYQLVCGVG